MALALLPHWSSISVPLSLSTSLPLYLSTPSPLLWFLSLTSTPSLGKGVRIESETTPKVTRSALAS